MNIRDSYLHGVDGKGVIKSLFFVTAADVQNNNTLTLNDLGVILADANNTVSYLTIPTLNLNTTGYAGSIMTQARSNNSDHYLVFVDSNNTNATAENLYTDGDIKYNPSTNLLTVNKVTINTAAGFNYSAIETGTSASTRCVWFSNNSYQGIPVINTNFTFNPAEGPTGHVGTLHVNNVTGDNIAITIGNTRVALGGTYTPDTSISSSSTNNTIPSSKAVWNAILSGMQANDAMVFKGFLDGSAAATGTNATFTPAASRGDTYKVRTAGYINGDYYQVNDTFICTTDGTVAADSTNVATVKTNWGVVEGNGDYLNIHGGTMHGTLKWNGAAALPEQTSPEYFLVIDAFADGGTTRWSSLANVRTKLATGFYWANVAVSTASSTATEPQFAKVGIAGAKDGTAKLKVYGNEIITGNLTIGGCTLVYDSSTPCLKFTF